MSYLSDLSRFSVRALGAAATAVLTLSLVACAKPPSCGDAKAQSTARDLVLDVIRKGIDIGALDDPDGLMPKFINALNVELSAIVNEGYDSDTKKQSCKGTLKVASSDGKSVEAPVKYTMQMTEDKGTGGFLMEMDGANPVIAVAKNKVLADYDNVRYAGTWTGTYFCNGIDGVEEGAQGPYKQDVTMVVEGVNTKLERTTKGGGFESLTGEVHSGNLGLSGVGRNSPEDAWKIDFDGEIKGRVMHATGQSKIFILPASDMSNGQLLRNCVLDLTQQPQ